MSENPVLGEHDVPSVLFVCVHNGGRSQMAAGWLTHLAGDRVEVRSAGTAPGAQVNPVAVTAMAEVGIDTSGRTPRLLTPDTVLASDVVVTMGCGGDNRTGTHGARRPGIGTPGILPGQSGGGGI